MAVRKETPAAKSKAKSPAKPKSKLTAKSAAKSKAKSPAKPKSKLTAKSAAKSKPKVAAKATPKPVVKRKKKTTGTSHFENIKKALIEQRESLLSEAGMVINDPDRVGSCPDLTDLASAENDQAFALKLKEREQKLLNKIAETLERIGEGSYGICQGCEAPIPYPRLKARPVTTLCIECKTLEEEEERIRLG